ncbi:AbrB/MazE/SpoVT family DNA-binding domain-containing protein [Deinococcus sp. AJ005]|uniref:AbrB/MazE/SpoVT family DNA-binding domain-containing protein n=1 Tax=Deinococcus sp. AJ005 TaxID=2652443 RepID=UPI00125CCF49|nr:AbrB/MazE/SpoVT family DNA-binding domain-containing protein [Deinococcus sp. AJ005]QFP77192.1 AbrB/MazE/SpoVT family DNA-binding domain-containing protein [Deinococcus sp. AJ005]
MTAKSKPPSQIFQGTVSSKRQITIPAEAFRQLRLQPGDKVAIEVRDGQLHLTPTATDFEALTRQHIGSGGQAQDATKEVREMRGWTEYEDEAPQE